MKDIIQQIGDWEDTGKKFALATVVGTWRSAPRQVGASMIISEDLQIIGSVSGGCVEGDVIREARDVLSTGKSRLLSFGVSNEDAWSAGLSCGGGIKVFVQPFFTQTLQKEDREIWKDLKSAIEEDKPVALLTSLDESAIHQIIRPGETSESLPPGTNPDLVKQAFLTGNSEVVDLNGKSWFLQIFVPKSQLLIIGASHISYDLIKLAQGMDFSTTVVDPRGIFTESLASICHPEQLLRRWPEEVLPDMTLDHNMYAVLLTHDPKIDDQALHILLPSGVAYIGALGSRKTHARRLDRLKEAGFTETLTDKIHAPIGLSIGASSPAEIALSIIGELVKVRSDIRAPG